MQFIFSLHVQRGSHLHNNAVMCMYVSIHSGGSSLLLNRITRDDTSVYKNNLAVIHLCTARRWITIIEYGALDSGTGGTYVARTAPTCICVRLFANPWIGVRLSATHECLNLLNMHGLSVVAPFIIHTYHNADYVELERLACMYALAQGIAMPHTE